MNIYIKHKQPSFLYRILSAFIAFTFAFSLITPPIQAQTILNLPIPGTMLSLSSAYMPTLVRGMALYPENSLQFDFLIDHGDEGLEGDAFKEESRKLIKYFLATLTTPEKELWVNLSPYEQDRVIPQGLDETELGRDLLAQDYILKQLTASLIYPEDKLGGEFWDRVYAKAQKMYGTTEIPLNTFNKVWVVPDKAVVYEHEQNVFILENHLKVMLEEDYEALQSNLGTEKFSLDHMENAEAEVISGVISEIVKEILIPEIEKEVNEGENFANLRQIYNSMLLATWYKRNLQESLLGQVYVDKKKTKGVDVQDKEIKQKIFSQYVEAFKKGVYDYIRDDFDSATQQIIPRKYFSGGFESYASSSITTLTQKDGIGSSVVEAKSKIEKTTWAATEESATVLSKKIKEAVKLAASPLDQRSKENSPFDFILNAKQLRNLHFGSIPNDAVVQEIMRAKNSGRVMSMVEYEANLGSSFGLEVGKSRNVFVVQESEESPALYFVNEGDFNSDGLLKKQLKPQAYQVFHVVENKEGRSDIFIGKAFLDFLAGVRVQEEKFYGKNILNRLINRIIEGHAFTNTQSDKLELFQLLSAIQYSIAFRWDDILQNDSTLGLKYLNEKEGNEALPVQVPIGYDDDGMLQLDWLQNQDGKARPLMCYRPRSDRNRCQIKYV